MKNYPTTKDLTLLLSLAFLAPLVHGSHPGVEDAEIYLPGVKKARSILPCTRTIPRFSLPTLA